MRRKVQRKQFSLRAGSEAETRHMTDWLTRGAELGDASDYRFETSLGHRVHAALFFLNMDPKKRPNICV